MKYFEMFTGIAGFSVGIDRAYGDGNKYESSESEQTDGASGRVGLADGRGAGVLSANDASLRNGGGNECLSASDSARSDPSPAESSDTATPASQTTEMQQSLFAMSCQISTFSAVDFLARISVLLESDKALMGQEALCFLRSHGFYHTKDPDIFYSKTLKVCLVLTMDKLTREYLGFSPISTTVWKQLCLTANTTAFPRTGKECFLSDILEASVSEKYFLSEKLVNSLLKTADKGLGYSAERSIATITKAPTGSEQ